MKPLIDSDILLYEIGFGCEAGWEEDSPPPFQMAQDLLENRISHICAMVDSDEDPLFLFTGKNNFRFNITNKVKYKNRVGKRPFHYRNIEAYIKGKYEWRQENELEADDLLAIEQVKGDGQTIICSRDKDLRQVPGWHYGWETRLQPSFGPLLVEGFGKLELSSDRRKLQGYGDKFFYSQLLTGDSVDTVPGLPKFGPVAAYELLKEIDNSKDALEAVYRAYKRFFGLEAYSYMLEQGRLLWLVRGLNEDGSPKMWGMK